MAQRPFSAASDNSLERAQAGLVDSLDPALIALRSELEHLDNVVVSHGDHICVRLPLISSVEIHHSGNRFRFTPQFGPFKRSGGLLFTSGISAAAVTASALYAGLSPLTLVVGFLGVIALAHDACRFVITEGCLTRLQNIIAASGSLRSPRDPTTLSEHHTPRLGA
jgi:hypothetical protein